MEQLEQTFQLPELAKAAAAAAAPVDQESAATV
jgi:hypothetical protein